MQKVPVFMGKNGVLLMPVLICHQPNPVSHLGIWPELHEDDLAQLFVMKWAPL